MYWFWEKGYLILVSGDLPVNTKLFEWNEEFSIWIPLLPSMHTSRYETGRRWSETCRIWPGGRRCGQRWPRRPRHRYWSGQNCVLAELSRTYSQPTYKSYREAKTLQILVQVSWIVPCGLTCALLRKEISSAKLLASSSDNLLQWWMPRVLYYPQCFQLPY